jgi:sporulation protein YlmC with PRC-barrel domain
MRIIDDIHNKEVIDTQANILGVVGDIELDTISNSLKSLIIVKSSGFTKDNEEVQIPFEDVLKIGDKIIVKDPLEDFIIH